jgi:cell division transport system ATP-binding protein
MSRSAVANGREGGTTALAEPVVVRLQNVAKRYGAGAEILHDVSLALEPGGFYFLTGASGAGKTSLLSIVCLVEPPSRGALRLFGTDAAGLDRAGRAALRRRIGIVFQDCRLIEDLSVADNIALPLRIAGAPEQEIRDRVAALMRWFGLERQIEARPGALSGGDRQRIAVARAIVSVPDLLVADEPTGPLDDESADLLIRVFERLNTLGKTVLIATHDSRLASRFEHPRFHLERGSLQRVEAVAA